MFKQFLIFIILILSFSQCFAIEFDDVSKDDWYYEAINILSDKGILNGIISENKMFFHPNIRITRAEFFKILSLITNDIEYKNDVNLDEFIERNSIIRGKWYDKYIDDLIKKGIINDDINHMPVKLGFYLVEREGLKENVIYLNYLDNLITREEIAKFLSQILDKDIEVISTNLVDVYNDNFDNVDDLDILRCYTVGIFNGFPDLSFRKDGYVNRGELATIILRYLDKSKRLDNSKNKVYSLRELAKPTLTTSKIFKDYQTDYQDIANVTPLLKDKRLGIRIINNIRYFRGLLADDPYLKPIKERDYEKYKKAVAIHYFRKGEPDYNDPIFDWNESRIEKLECYDTDNDYGYGINLGKIYHKYYWGKGYYDIYSMLLLDPYTNEFVNARKMVNTTTDEGVFYEIAYKGEEHIDFRDRVDNYYRDKEDFIYRIIDLYYEMKYSVGFDVAKEHSFYKQYLPSIQKYKFVIDNNEYDYVSKIERYNTKETDFDWPPLVFYNRGMYPMIEY